MALKETVLSMKDGDVIFWVKRTGDGESPGDKMETNITLEPDGGMQYVVPDTPPLMVSERQQVEHRCK